MRIEFSLGTLHDLFRCVSCQDSFFFFFSVFSQDFFPFPGKNIIPGEILTGNRSRNFTPAGSLPSWRDPSGKSAVLAGSQSGSWRDIAAFAGSWWDLGRIPIHAGIRGGIPVAFLQDAI